MDMKRILQALDGASTKPVEGANDMKKFMSVVTEGANPHKVALPVQMAMNHYQEPVAKPAPKKPSLLKQYFAEAEDQQEQERLAKQESLRMYSQKIANRVLMKESSLKDKEDLQAKRKALQDIQADPNTSKDSTLKAELIRRKAALEKEAKAKGLAEARLSPEQMAKLSQFKQQNAKPVEPQRPEQLSPEKQSEIDDWARDVEQRFANRSTAPVRTHRVQPQGRIAEPAAPVEEPARELDVSGMKLPEVQAMLAKIDQLLDVMQKVEKLTVRAGNFPGGLTPGLTADLEIDVPTPTSMQEYDTALDIWNNKLAKLQNYISVKRATWAKKKTPMYENEEQPVRDPRAIQQDIKAAQKQLAKVQYTFTKVREITKEIKYDNTAGDIILRVRTLAQATPDIDAFDLKSAEDAVFKATSDLQSAVYGLEEAFEYAVRHAQDTVDNFETELEEIEWKKKYGRPE